MDSENKHEHDEDEGATDTKIISSCDASCGPESDGTANASESFTSKRGFSESSSSDSVAVEEERSELASKRRRIEAVGPCEIEEQGTSGLDTEEANVDSADVGQGAFSTNHSDGGRTLPSVSSPPEDFSTFDTLPLKADAERKPAQETVSLVPERHTPFPPEEMSVSCSFGNAETVLKSRRCGRSLSSCSALEEHVECRVEQEKKCACCHCSHRAESSSPPHVHVKHTHGPQKIFSCDLCGFQCAEENLLNAHYLGKTHLRRQNLAARGGFQSLLPPKELPQSGVGTRDDELALAPAPKRGRPKGSISRTCSHCGLLASSITNLTVHIRRKHSHQYSYLCKVCKYYTVTKGDMERHCATKKHKGRVEIEANGKQSSDIIVGPEGGDLEECKKNSPGAVTASDEQADRSAESAASPTDKPVVDCGNAVEVEAENVFHSGDGEGSRRLSDRKGQLSLDPEDLLQQNDVCSQRDVAGSGDNRCLHCEFSAHSAASLELHVKRKHTKEFEFYCMACDYYAVTRREMTRHAATEKHKMKRQSYLNSSAVEAVEIVTEEDHSFCETLQQPLAKDKSMKPGEIVSLNTPSNHGSPGRLQADNPGDYAADCETGKENHGLLNDAYAGDPRTRCQGEGGSTSDSGGKVLDKSLSSGDLDGDRSAESTPPAGDLDGGGQSKAGCESSAEDLKDVQADPVLENKEILMNSQHEIVLEEDGPASDDTVDSNDVYETIISIDDKGQTMYSFGRFDSSIIRIKTSEDGELVDQSEEGLLAAGVRVSELPPKDCVQGLKKRKVEGSSFGESTRIRCDDCGFLADGLSGLNVHIAMKHPTKEKHFHCLLCGKSFYTESNLHQHLASAGHMRNEQASVEELPEGGATFKCVKCTEPFDSEQNLFLHIKGQHEELLREVNKYIVEDTEQINREREENQGNICKYCGKMCRSSNSMAFLAHIRTHTVRLPSSYFSREFGQREEKSQIDTESPVQIRLIPLCSILPSRDLGQEPFEMRGICGTISAKATVISLQPDADMRQKNGAEVGTVSDPMEVVERTEKEGRCLVMGRAGWRGLLGLEERALRGECCGSAVVCNGP
ncbi:Zinc finger protein 407 [Microtus ochrogaster]|uniref:Zinc finger protein 407 n=1 Tax=Microtus ochrogaster TaxID=79684 RepID=A0A8J6FXM9_MICOH|nr:Zinc finger protein 407 [Microtus ochrogaster]